MSKYIKKTIILLGVFLGDLGLAWATPASSFSFKDVLHQKIPQATASFVVKSCSSAKSIIDYNPKKYLSPASVSKLFMAVTALKVLTPAYKFKTEALEQNSNLYFRFSGDPSFTDADLESMVVDLKNNNVRMIKGNIYIDNSIYSAPNYPDGASHEDFGWYYNAPIGSVILNRNALTYTFNTSKSGDITFHPHSPELGKHFHLKSMLSLQKNVMLPCQIYLKPDGSTNTLLIHGCLKYREKPFDEMIAVSNPELYVSNLLKAMLIEHGIDLKGKITIGQTPDKAKIITSHQSAPLSDLLQFMLLHSDNVYAGSLTKLVGLKLTGKGSFDTGAYAINTTIAKLLNLPVKQFHLYDGIGNRYNLVTNNQVIALLGKIFQDKNLFNVLINALPVSGVRGSLEYRMSGKMKGRVYAKTGSMHDMSALAGFINPFSNDCKIFSIITNNSTIKKYQLKNFEDEVLNALVKSNKNL